VGVELAEELLDVGPLGLVHERLDLRLVELDFVLRKRVRRMYAERRVERE